MRRGQGRGGRRRCARWWPGRRRRAAPCDTGRSRSRGCHGRSLASILARRSASTSSSTSRASVRARTSMSTRSPSSINPMTPPAAASGETCPTEIPLDPPENRPSVTSAHCRAQPGALEERGRVQHLLHPGPAGRPLVAHHQHVAGLDLLGQDDRDRLLLALHDPRRALEAPDVLRDAGGLDHRAVRGDVAAQHGQPAVGGVGVLAVPDAAAGRVGVQRRPAVRRGERLGGAHPAGRGVEQLDGLLRRSRRPDVPLGQPLRQRRRVHRVHRRRSAARPATARPGWPGCRRPGARPPCGSRSSATPWPGTAPAGTPRRWPPGRSRSRPPGRRPGCAARCWSSRPWPRPGPSRSRRPPGWRSSAAAPTRRRRRTSAARATPPAGRRR